MREIYRRIATAFFFLVAVGMLFYCRSEFVRVYPVDMVREYRRTYAPDSGPTLGAMAMGRSLIRSTAQFQPIGEFIRSKTEGVTVTVEGESWKKVYSSLKELQGESLFYLPSNSLVSPVVEDLRGKKRYFSYVKIAGSPEPVFMATSLLEPAEAKRIGVPESLMYPFRSLFLIPMVMALAVYVLIPKKRIRPGALTYSKWSCWLIPDAMSLLLAGFFVALSFILSTEVQSSAIVFMPVFWSMGAVFLSMLFWSARYSSFELILLDEGIELVQLSKELAFRFSDLATVEWVDYRPPKWLRIIVRVAAIFNWRMWSHSVAMSLGRDWGIRFVLKDGSSFKFICSRLPEVQRLVDVLVGGKVPLSDELELFLKGGA